MNKGLHAIETASRDEIVALQTERLKWTLHHVSIMCRTTRPSSTRWVSIRTT